MRKKMFVTAVTAALAFSGLVVAAPAQAAPPKSYCEGNASINVCYTVTNKQKNKRVVEAVPVENRMSRNVKVTCTFSKTLSYSASTTTSAGASVKASVKAAVFASVEAGVTSEVSKSLTQSPSVASSLAGSFTLKPGESAVCKRIYSDVSATVKAVTSKAGKVTDTAYYKTTVPSRLGALYED